MNDNGVILVYTDSGPVYYLKNRERFKPQGSLRGAFCFAAGGLINNPPKEFDTLTPANTLPGVTGRERPDGKRLDLIPLASGVHTASRNGFVAQLGERTVEAREVQVRALTLPR